MYCKMCGNLLDDTDIECKKCGAAVEGRAIHDVDQEEIVYNPSFDDPVQNTQESHDEEPVEENKSRSEKEGIIWDVYEFPKSKISEEAVFNWQTDEDSPEDKPLAFEEALFEEIRESGDRIQAEQLDKFFTFSKKNEEFQKLLDKEYERLKIRSEKVFIKESEPVGMPEIHKDLNIQQKPVIADQTDSQLKEMAAARENYFKTSSNDDNEKHPDTIMPVESETASVQTDSIKEDSAPAELKNTDTVQPDLDQTDSVRSDFDKAADKHSEGKKDAVADTIVTPVPIAIDKPANKEKRGGLGKILLIVLAIILTIEILILGIRYFAPNSAAAGYIEAAQSQAAAWVVEIQNKISGEDTPEEGTPVDQEAPGDNTTPPDEQPSVQEPTITEPDPKPAEDMNALITSQLGYNLNIEKVTANKSLAFNPAKDYGVADINNSVPIENNIWMNEQGKDPVYYDASIVGTIIDFDSKWIDYVNGKSDKVFGLLKENSKAYQNAASFSKVGKVNETFKLLEIGEIRKGSNGFYVWVHEEIQIEENGNIQNKKYNWIYYLEPVSDQMKIVNYYIF